MKGFGFEHVYEVDFLHKSEIVEMILRAIVKPLPDSGGKYYKSSNSITHSKQKR